MPRNIEQLDIAYERRNIDCIWPGSGPGYMDPTADRLRNVALHYLDIIEAQRTTEASTSSELCGTPLGLSENLICSCRLPKGHEGECQT